MRNLKNMYVYKKIGEILPIMDSGTSSARSEVTDTLSTQRSELTLNIFEDQTFPFQWNFMKCDPKQREILFCKFFEEKINYIRGKELKCGDSPARLIDDAEKIKEIVDKRNLAAEKVHRTECRKRLSNERLVSNNEPAIRIDTDLIPSYDPYLNVNYTAQSSVLNKFKEIISEIMITNRVKDRINKIKAFISREYNTPKKSGATDDGEKLSVFSLLNIHPVIAKDVVNFVQPQKITPLDYPILYIEPHSIERPVEYYQAHPVEKYNLTTFPRTEVNAFIHIPIQPPEIYPTVKEEQPVTTRDIDFDSQPSPLPRVTSLPKSSDVSSTISKSTSTKKLPTVSQADINLLQSFPPVTIKYPREYRFFDFDPASSLKPQKIDLPPIPIEVGRSSILAIPPSDYEPMFLYSNHQVISPFEFSGVPKFAETGLKKMTEPNPIDLRELENDADVDNIDVAPKPKPITEFLQKPVSTKNKSHIIAESVFEGQSKWRERQRNQVKLIIDQINTVNELFEDQSLKLNSSDLQHYFENE